MARAEALQNSGTIEIPSAGTESTEFSVAPYANGGFILPAAFTGTAISFKVSTDGTNYSPLYDSSNALVSITVTQGRAYAFPIAMFSWPWALLVSNAAEGADREIALSQKY